MVGQEEIHKQCFSNDQNTRIEALKKLRNNFSSLPNKEQAWDDLHRLTYDEDRSVRSSAIRVLGSAFSQVSNKQQAWSDLHRLTKDEDLHVRSSAAEALGSAFSYVPNKKLAWNDLYRLTGYESISVRYSSAQALGSAFSHVPDKQQAWNVLHMLTYDESASVRYSSIYSFDSAFSHVPDKQQAWNVLLRLTSDEDMFVRSRAVEALGSAFSHIEDKQQAWEDLYRLTIDKDWGVRYSAIKVLVSAFSHIEDKQQAWEDLYRLTIDKDKSVRYYAVEALGSAFSHIGDKQQAWNVLHRLTYDKDRSVRSSAARVLGSAFSHIEDKHQAWKDLHRLTKDGYNWVRANSNHSLGRVSIFKASQSENEEEYKRELETAIVFFEKATKESPDKWSNPSQFCLPFYRSYHTIVFKKQGAKEEVDIYLIEAKDAVRGSKSKELLFETVENLANALKEVQNLESLDLEAKKDELNFFRQYCDRAAELMRNTEEIAPYATAVMRKGLHILDRNLKEILEIQKKTEVIREQTRGTQFEKLGNELNQNSQSLLQVRDQVGLEKQVKIMQNILRNICSKFPKDQKGEACELLNMMYAEPSIEDKIPFMVNILSKFSYQLDMTVHLNRIEEKLDHKLSCISYDIFKIKLNSYNVITNLDAMKKELKKLNEIEGLNESVMEKLSSTQVDKINDLNNNILERLDEIRILIEGLPNNDDTQKITDSLNELRQSEPDVLLQRSSAVISLIGFIMQVLPQVLVHKPV
ncbi:HEAT repeat domain-containing protein [Methanosarcina sp.]|uniref:HEAT repeat domain-containing protein n=1 Tax=Methanosarcina sp. TaxID=2213 RepID=UPI003BB5802F